MGSWHQPYEEFIASHRFETPTSQLRLMEVICERNNNKGASGVDGMTVRKINRHLKRHWTKIEKALLDGTYTPMPVRRKEIPKPGGVRLLGIPTVLDRVIQQAVAQILNRIWDHTFSECSFGFRPKRSAHDAIRKYREYVQAGLRYVVDIDLAKFFDRVNHDRLSARLATRVKDKRVLKLIRSFLVGRPWQRKYLGFCLTNSRKNPKVRIHWKTIKRFKQRAREITARRRGRSLSQVIDELNQFISGWWNYYGKTESFNRLRPLPHWIRRRLRALVWKHWPPARRACASERKTAKPGWVYS